MTDVLAIDAVVNPMTPEMQPDRPEWSESFYVGKIGRGHDLLDGVTLIDMLAMMDQAGIERAFLIACKVGQIGLQGSWHLPYETIAALEGVEQLDRLDEKRALVLARADSGALNLETVALP